MSPENPDRKNTKDPRFAHLDLENAEAAYSNEMTGMVPANPQLTDQLDAYADIHNFGNRTPRGKKPPKNRS